MARVRYDQCVCGHLVDEHQTGEGPWTGFCYGDQDPINGCKCESPRKNDEPTECYMCGEPFDTQDDQLYGVHRSCEGEED